MLPHRAPRGRGAARLRRSEPTHRLAGVTHCAVKPSQRLLVSRHAEPADNGGTCPLLRFWNEPAAPARAEADAQSEQWLRRALPRAKLFRGAKVPVCHSDGRVINGFGRTNVPWL